MRTRKRRRAVLSVCCAACTLGWLASAQAQDTTHDASTTFRLSRTAPAGAARGPAVAFNARGLLADAGWGMQEDSEPGEEREPLDESGLPSGYREINEFFNVREANPSTTQGQWELEIPFAWTTRSNGEDDDFTAAAELEYGLTDDLTLSLELEEINFGDGGDQGNGDIALGAFYRFVEESDTLPAIAAWAEMRLPTGEGSSGVDGELHFNVTRTLTPPVRIHAEGFVETANGGRGDEDEDRRPLQWGVGVGADYSLDAETIFAVNYLLQSSEETGEPDQNILELGMVHEIAPQQDLKIAFDIGLDGHEETPNFAAKVMWTIEWR